MKMDKNMTIDLGGNNRQDLSFYFCPTHFPRETQYYLEFQVVIRLLTDT